MIPLSAWIERLRSPDPAVRREALAALRRAGPEAVDALPALAELAGQEPDALHALIGFGPRAIRPVAGALAARDVRLRRIAEEAMARWAEHDETAAAELLSVAADSPKALASLKLLGVKALGGLSRSLGHADPRVVDRACELLGQLGPAARAALPALAERASRPAALRALAAVDGGGEKAVEALAAALEAPDGELSREAKRVLERDALSPAGLKRLALLLAHPDEARRRGPRALARLAGTLQDPEPPDPESARWSAELEKARGAGALAGALRKAVDALSDPAASTRWAAARAIGGLGADGVAALPMLIDLLAGEDPGPATEALRRLGTSAAPAAPALAWRALAFDDPDARAALKAIGPAKASPTVDASLARVRPRVARAEEGAPARVGDRVLRADGAPLLTTLDWKGDARRVTLWRDGATLEIEWPGPFAGVELEDPLEALLEGHARTPRHLGRTLALARALFEKGEYVRVAELAKPFHEARPGTPAQVLAGAAATAYGLRGGNAAMARQGLAWVEAYLRESESRWSPDFAALGARVMALAAEAGGRADAAKEWADEAAWIDGRKSGPWVGRVFPDRELPALPDQDDPGEPRACPSNGHLAIALLGTRRGAAVDEALERLSLLARRAPLAIRVVREINERVAGGFDVRLDAGGALSAATGTTRNPMLFFVNAEGVVEEQAARLTDALARRVAKRAEGALKWRTKAEALPPPVTAPKPRGVEGRLRALVIVGNGFRPGDEETREMEEELRRRHPALALDERSLRARFGVSGWSGPRPEAELAARCRAADPRLAEALGGGRTWWEEAAPGGKRMAALLAAEDAPRISLRFTGPWPDAEALWRALAGGLAAAGDRALDPETGRTFDLRLADGAATLSGPGASPENAAALLKAAGALVRAGAEEVVVESSGLVAPAKDWAGRSAFDALTARAFAPGKSRSRGFHAFGLRDAELADPRRGEAEALEALRAFDAWRLSRKPELRDGQTVSPRDGERWLLLGKPDRGSGPALNPYGVWALSPV